MASDSFMASFDFGGLVETRPPSRSNQRRPHTPPQPQSPPRPQPQPSQAPELTEYDLETQQTAELEIQTEETLQSQEYLDNIVINEDPFAEYQPSWGYSKDANETVLKEAQWMKDKKSEIAAACKEMSVLQQTLVGLIDSASQISDLAAHKIHEPAADSVNDITSLLHDDRERIIEEWRPKSLLSNVTILSDKVPRLFLVLPWEKESWNLGDISTYKFRLYFFCEHGDYSQMPNSPIPHTLHIAKHSGYNLLEPLAFFKRFGEYTLVVMETLRREMLTRRVVVPTEGYLNNLDGIRHIIEGYEHSNKTLAPVVEETIDFIRTHVTNRDELRLRSENGARTGSVGTHVSPSLEEESANSLLMLTTHEEKFLDYGAIDLPSHLENGLEEIKRLGNLYRTAVDNDIMFKPLPEKGAPKFVCMDHYIEHYCAYAIDRVEEFVTEAEGILDRIRGIVDVTFNSSRPAEQFYGAVYRAENLCMLRLRLNWEVSSYDMDNVMSAILKSGLAVVEIDGSAFEHPVRSSFVGQSNRFDPLLHLMVHSSLKTLSVTNCPAFLTRIADLQDKAMLRSMILSFKGNSRASVNSQQAVIRTLDYLNLENREGTNLDIVDSEMLLIRWDRNRGDIRLSTVTLTNDLFMTGANSKGKSKALASALTQSVLAEDAQLTSGMVTGGLLRIIVQTVSKETLPLVANVIAVNPALSEVFAQVTDGDLLSKMEFYYRESIHSTAPLKVTFLDRSQDGQEKTLAVVVFHPQASSLHSHCAALEPDQREVEVLDWKYDHIDGPITDLQAVLLDYATKQHPSVMLTWSLDVSLLMKPGLTRARSALARSNVVSLQVNCYPIKQTEVWDIQQVLSVMNWSAIKSLTLFGSAVEEWMPLFTIALYEASPPCVLQEFGINVYNPAMTMSDAGTKWIYSMMTMHPLTDLRLCNVHLTESDWKIIIGALEFSRLEHLDLNTSNIYWTKPLLDAMESELACSSSLPLKVLNLQSTLWQKHIDTEELTKFLLSVAQKIPSVTVLVGQTVDM
ncbi:hypothetical protein BGZ93_006991 [Podila epicladia]|nr:hypothetical protein BGZ92_004002 [Podila epicladia]KAG0094632.1 hypothetical protein BGZ93_006991 [Podila epicladia]